MDAAGTLVAKRRYKPFGEQRYTFGDLLTDYKYSGQREDEYGLYDYKARHCDPLLGRFTSPDTLIPEPGSPLAWDRYAYVKNNPVRFNDPTGHCAEALTLILCAAVAGAFIGGAIDAVIQYQETGKIDLNEVAGAAVSGAASAVVLTAIAPASLVSAFFVGGAANVIGSQVGALVEGGLDTDQGENFFDNYADAGGVYNGEKVTNLDKSAVSFAIGGTLNAGSTLLRHVASKYFYLEDPLAQPKNYNPIEFKYTGQGRYTMNQRSLGVTTAKSTQAIVSQHISDFTWDLIQESSAKMFEKKINKIKD